MGTLWDLKYFSNSSLIIMSLNFLLNGPAYETKADDINTSPTITLICSSRTTIDFAHLSFSLPKALTSLWAKFNLLAHLYASLIAPCFSSSACWNYLLSCANSALSLRTISCTSLNLIVAFSSWSLASSNCFLRGPTSWMTS